MLEGCIVLQSDDDISCSPPKAASTSCLKGLTQGWRRVLVSLAYMLLRTYLCYGTPSIARPLLPACGPFSFTLSREYNSRLYLEEGEHSPSASHIFVTGPSSFSNIT